MVPKISSSLSTVAASEGGNFGLDLNKTQARMQINKLSPAFIENEINMTFWSSLKWSSINVLKIQRMIWCKECYYINESYDNCSLWIFEPVSSK